MAEKKIFELSVMSSDIDKKVYFDADLKLIKSTDELIKIIKVLGELQSSLLDKYLGFTGIQTGNANIKIN